MPLEVKLRIVMNENARGDKRECIESIRKPEDEVCYVFPPEYQARDHHPRFIDSEESRKQLNQGRPLQKHCSHEQRHTSIQV